MLTFTEAPNSSVPPPAPEPSSVQVNVGAPTQVYSVEPIAPVHEPSKTDLEVAAGRQRLAAYAAAQPPQDPTFVPPPSTKIERDRLEDLETIRRNNEILGARGHISPPDLAPPPAPPPRTPVMTEKLKEEVVAGQRALERHAERARLSPRQQKSAAEIASEGRNVEVLRPGEFREYALQFPSPAQTPSKDQGGAQGPLIVGDPEGGRHTAVYVPTPGRS
jgi:hypothetical protein